MGIIGNILWLLFGGLITACMWLVAGIACCCSIVGIPLGLQCFKLAGLSLWPMGKEIIYHNTTLSFIGNVIWVLLCGLALCITYISFGIIWCCTIVGMPLGKQCFKLARLSLMPFGAEIY